MYFLNANHQMFKENGLEEEFIQVYKEVFRGAPFYEDFTENEVREILTKYLLPESYLVIAIKDNKMVGYGASIPATFCPGQVREILSKYVVIEETIFNADLAVLPDYRRMGIGTRLIELRNEYSNTIGAGYIAMRTNKTGSLSKGIYLRHGFEELPESMQVKQKRIDNRLSEVDERVLLVKSISHTQEAIL